jgi:hypothetical protein
VVVALNFPRQPNQGLFKTVHSKYAGRGRPFLQNQDKRLCEMALQRTGLKINATPSDPQLCPAWMRQGFLIFERLEAAGFSHYNEEAAPQSFFETHSEALFRSLLGQPLLNHKTLEGRIQRQLLLAAQDLRIADAMEFFEEITRHRLMQGSLPLQKLYTIPELEALGAAYMAWYAVNRPQQVSRVGDADEGQLLLPYWKELENTPSLEAQQMPIFG